MEDIFAPKSGSFGIGSPKEEKIPDLFAEPEPPSSNPIVNLSRGLVKGAVYGVPQQVAKASQFLGIGGTEKGDIAQKISDWGEEGLGGKNRQPGMFEQAGEMIPESVGIPMGLFGAGKAISLIPHPVAKVAGAGLMATGKMGQYVVPAIFGLSQAQTTRETAKERGVDEGMAPYLTGGIEWGGETLGNIAAMRLFGPLGKVGSALVGKVGAKQTMQGTIGGLLKELALVTMPTEIGTEMGQNYFEALVEKRQKIRPEADPWSEAVSAIGPTAIMTMLVGGAGGAFSHYVAGKQADILANPIEGFDPNNLTDEAVAQYVRRANIAGGVEDLIPEENKALKEQWRNYAAQKIEKNLPIDVDMALDSLAMEIDTQMDNNPVAKQLVQPWAPVGFNQPPGTLPNYGPEDFGGVQGAATGVEGIGPGYGMGGQEPPPTFDFTGLGEVPGSGTGVGGMGGIYEPPPAPSKFTTMFNSVLNGEPAGTGDPRLDQVIAGEHTKGNIEAPDDIQGIIDDYNLGEYDEEYPPAKPSEGEKPPTGVSDEDEIVEPGGTSGDEPENPPPGEPAKLSPVPPPVNGKRNWYEFKDLPLEDLDDEEMDRLASGTGPTLEETAAYDQWRVDTERAQAQGQKQEDEQRAAGQVTSEEILSRVKKKWSENNPHISVREAAGHIAAVRQSGGEKQKAGDYLAAVSKRAGIPNRYEALGRILDKLGIGIEITDGPSADTTGGSVTDGVYYWPRGGPTKDNPGRIVISHRAMAGSRDFGPGYGVAHMEEVFVHEALHGIVRNAPNWEQSKKRLEAFRDTLRAHEKSAPDSVKKYLKHSDKYDIDELISEALSDAKTAQWLDSIPAEGVRNPSKTLWGRLKDIIFRALETFGFPKSKLDEFNEILDEVLAISPEGVGTGVQDQQAAEEQIPTHELYGSLDNINTVNLSELFVNGLFDAQGITSSLNKYTIKEYVAKAFDIKTSDLNKYEAQGKYDHKAVEEAFEYAIVKWARNHIRIHGANSSLYDFESVYKRQPNLASRTSDSTIMQQYSTPLPLAWLMNKFLGLVGVKSNLTVYEPTAGNGMLLIGANPSLATANELDTGPRIANLTDFLRGGTVTNADALSGLAGPLQRESQDRIVANPPFGAAPSKNFGGYNLTKLEHQIVAEALSDMKNEGKAAFIIGGKNLGSDGSLQLSMADKVFYNFLYNNYYVTHNMDISGDLYSRQGTSYPVRLITVEGRREEPKTGIPDYGENGEIRGAFGSFYAIAEELERRGKDETTRTDGKGQGDDTKGQTSGAKGGKGLPPDKGLPPGAGPGGQEPGSGELPGGGTGTDTTLGGAGQGEGGAGEQPAGGQKGEGRTDTGGDRGDGVRGGERGTDTTLGKTPEGKGAVGESGGVKGTSAVDQAIDALGDIEVPSFAPYEKAAEEDFYQEKMKPAAENIASAIVAEEGPDVQSQTFLEKLKARLKDKYDTYKKYMFRWAREEFRNFVQMIKDASIFQTRYKPHSGGPAGNTLVPKNQEQSIQNALDEIEKEHGAIDDWVMKELKYPDKESMFKAFAAEQIDALAMAMHNIQQNSGMILGDMTGVGKGRVVAGIIRWANVTLGKTPIFVTEKAGLFSDMYRDLTAIDHKIRPFIMNNNDLADIKDQTTGDIIINHKKDGKGRALRGSSVDWSAINADPQAYLNEHDMKVVFTTYSQHQSGGFKGQDMLLENLGPNNIFILDESHNSAGDASGGDGNTKLKFLHFLDMADGVLYSSATFAKTPHNMAIYFRTGLGDTGMRMWELVQAIITGGNPLQEYISAALAKKGQYLRRELDFSGIDYFDTDAMNNTAKDSPKYAELEKQYAKDKELADKTNVVTRSILRFSNELYHPNNRRALEAMIRAMGYMVGGSGPRNQRMSLTGVGFANVVHNFNSQLLAAMKADRTIEEARIALSEGRKVVINVQNTMESFIKDLIAQGKARVGEPLDFTYKSVLGRALTKTLDVGVKPPGGGNTIHVQVPLEMLRAFIPSAHGLYLQAQRELHTSSFQGLHASFIDYIKSEIGKFTKSPIMEITGRDHFVDYNDPSGKPVLRERDDASKDRQLAIRKFNTGISDVIIINRAGSVGISLHASQDFVNVDGTPQKPRRMLLLQPDLDINVFMQALGRVFRKGQVVDPDYRYITSDLPTEIRPAVVQRRKMSSLKANTTSKQEGAEARKEIPNMMNKYGNRVTREYLDNNKDTALLVGVIHQRHDPIPSDVEYAKVAGKLAVLPVELQKEFYDTVEADYESLIEELTAKGENELISKNYDYQAVTTVKNTVFSGLTDPDDPFTGSTYVEQVRVRQLKKPYPTAKLKELITKNLAGQKNGNEYADKLRGEVKAAFDEYWRQWQSTLNEKYPNEPDRQERARQERYIQLRHEMDTYETMINYFKIGNNYDIPLFANADGNRGGGENLNGVLVNIIWKPGAGNPVQLSKIKFVFAVPDPIQTMVYNGSQSWFREEGYQTEAKIPDNWDSRIVAARTEDKVIVTGNMLRAFNIVLSLDDVGFEMVNFTREGGKREFGLVIARKDEDKFIGLREGNMGREVQARDALAYLTDHAVELERVVASNNGVVNIASTIVTPANRKADPPTPARFEYVITVPQNQALGAKYYQDAELMELLRGKNFRRSGPRMIGNIANAEDLGRLLNVLADRHGLRFVIPQQSQPMPYEPGEEASFMPFEKAPQFVQDLTNKFLNNPQDDEGKKVIRPYLKSQHDFRWGDKYLGLPWWNAKRYPAWRRAFEIFGIDRPEHRGDYMHNFAKASEPFLALETNMRKAGKSSKDIQDANDRISRVIITGDAQLGPYLKSLRVQVKDMEEGPMKDRLLARIKQIETENRYSDEQLLEGIKDDQGNKVKLSQQEIEVYKSVRHSLDLMFDTYVDHLQSQAFRQYQKQKWYAILCQAAGIDLNKETTHKIIGAGLNQAALLRAVKIQPDIQKIFERVEAQIKETPDNEKMEAGVLYGKIADALTEQISSLEDALSTLTGETDPKKLTEMTKAIFSAYLYTRPQLKKIKTLRNTYKKQVAFFPRVRDKGEHKLRLMQQIKNKEGQVIKERQIFMKMFNTEAEGAKVYKEIMDRYGKDGVLPDDMYVHAEQATKTPEFAFQGVNDINMQRVLDDAIDGLKLRDVYYNDKGEKVDIHERLRNMGYMALAKQFQSRGFGQHMTHRQWNVIKGYKENNLQLVLFNYMTGMAGIMTKQVAAADFLEHMKDVKDRKLFESLVKYGRDQLRNETDWDRTSNKIRSMMFTWYLGGILRPAIIQLTQNFVTGIPQHAKYLRENKMGGAGKADKDYMTAMKDVATKNYTPVERRMEEQLLIEGVTVDQYIREIFGGLGTRLNQSKLRVLHYLAYPFSQMEIFNRKSAALTRFRPAYKAALAEGLSEEEAYNKAFESARDFVYDTHYAMGKANLPQIAQGEGVGTAVKTLYTFRSFTHNFALSLYNDRKDWKTVMHTMAYVALFGGLMGLPFFKDLFEFIEKHFGYSFTKSIKQSLNSVGGKTLETFGMNGLPAMLGANISGSLAMGVPFMGETPADTIYGVYGGMATKIKRAGEAAARGDKYRVFSNLAPEVLRSPIVAAEESKIGKELFGTPGYSTTTRGRPVYDETGKPLSLGTGEAMLKAVGFSPTENAAQKSKDQTIRRQESWAAEAKADAAETYRIARINKDKDALKNLMRAVKEINDGIRSRGIQNLVPLTSVAKIIQASKESQTKQQRREQRYKRVEL